MICAIGQNSSFPQCKAESDPKPDRAELSRGWMQIGLIVSAIALPVILSVIGVIPVLSPVVFYLGVAAVLVRIQTLYCSGRREWEDPFSEDMKKMTPFEIAIKKPVIEELLYRGVLQGGLEWGLMGIVSTYSKAAAAVGASTIFALVHSKPEGKWDTERCFNAAGLAFSTLLIEGAVFAYFGLWASTMVKVVMGTVDAIIIQANKSRQSQTALAAHRIAH